MPLLVNMGTGETLTFQLDRERDHTEWERLKRERAVTKVKKAARDRIAA